LAATPVRINRSSPRYNPSESTRLFRVTRCKRVRTACKTMGPPRLESLTIRHGRQTFSSHALAGNRSLAEVHNAAAHCNVSIASG